MKDTPMDFGEATWMDFCTTISKTWNDIVFRVSEAWEVLTE